MPRRYSPIGPIKILERLQEYDALGNYLLVLTHEVLADDLGYSLLLDSMPDSVESPAFIIMDNGVIELGKALTLDQGVEAADIARADCIVMPDVLGDFEGTMDLVLSQLPRLQDCGYPIMKVPQGKDLSEVVRCIDWLAEVEIAYPDDVDYWGIPRWISNKFGTRAPVIEYINTLRPDPTIHLLGMSHNWTDDISCAKRRNVIGIDSANPIVRGLLGGVMAGGEPEHVDRGDYWEKTDINRAVIENIKYVREAIT